MRVMVPDLEAVAHRSDRTLELAAEPESVVMFPSKGICDFDSRRFTTGPIHRLQRGIETRGPHGAIHQVGFEHRVASKQAPDYLGLLRKCLKRIIGDNRHGASS